MKYKKFKKFLFLWYYEKLFESFLLNGPGRYISHCQCFSTRVFVHRHWLSRTTGEWRGLSFILLYKFHPLKTFGHLFAILHVRWLLRIIIRTACVFQASAWWDLPPCWITIWVIDDSMLFFLLVYLMIWF